MKTPRVCALPILAILALSLPEAAPAAVEIYLAIGDSLAFGFTNTLDPSFGDRGYVGTYADILASRNGGARPNVINLGIFGETTSSFFGGGGGIGGPMAPLLNLNYPDATTTQESLLLSKIASEGAAGRTISTVSVSLGANDLFELALSPVFASLPPDQQQAMLLQTLGAIQVRYQALLTELRGLLPDTDLVLLGSYNPFPAVPSSPFAPLAAPAIGGLNVVVQGLASAFGGRYVDIDTPFEGREAELTHILDPPAGSNNVHPTDAEYAVIAARMAAVPEPGSLVLLGTGLLGLIGHGRHRRGRPA